MLSWSPARLPCLAAYAFSSAVFSSGPPVKAAHQPAYSAADAISFPTGFCRRDIGWREVAREEAQR